MGQYGTGCKEIIQCRLTPMVKGTELIIDGQAGPVGRVSPQIQKIFLVPFLSLLRLINRKIEEGFPDPVSIGPEPMGPKPSCCQNDPFSPDPFFAGPGPRSAKWRRRSLFPTKGFSLEKPV